MHKYIYKIKYYEYNNNNEINHNITYLLSKSPTRFTNYLITNVTIRIYDFVLDVYFKSNERVCMNFG